MLNLLYGWCGSTINDKYNNQFIDDKYQLNTQNSDYKTGGLCQYSKYKHTIHYTNEQYIFSLIGVLSSSSKIGQEDTLIAKEIIKQYEEQGVEYLKHLKGQFILSIIDKVNNSCLIVNDTMATFPLFYTLSSEGQLTFSNHLDLLTQSSDTPFEINPQAIYDYIYFHMIPSPITIFNNIFKLEPNQYLLFEKGQYHTKHYSSITFNEDNARDENDLAKDIFETLDQSVQDAVTDPKTTGSFLSGGLDSSAVTGLLAKNFPEHANSFSIGFPVEQYNEIEYARTASKQFKTTQYEYFIQPEDIPAILPDIVDAMDEPFGNSSVIPVYYCAKLAKKNGINHLLAGDGGDEIFAGNERYSKQKIFEYYFKLPNMLRKKIIEPIAHNSLLNSNFIGRKLKSYVDQANIPLPDRLETYNFLHINSPDSVFSSDFLLKINQDSPTELLNKTYNYPENASSLNRMLYLDWKHTLADNDLRKVNMMCEFADIDVSYPMLSEEMIALSCQIPSKLKLTPRKLRYLYKKSMNDFLPKRIINKPKHGFGLPFGIWTQTDKELQKIAYTSIENLKKYNIFSEQFLEDTIKNHKTVHASFYGELIWILMILGLWLDQHATK